MDDYNNDDDFNDHDYEYNTWDLIKEELKLPSIFSDYHPSWKKSKKTFLDLYFVAERTKQLLDFIGRPQIITETNYHLRMRKELETTYQSVEKHLAVSKKRSIAILSKVLGLPSLVIDKIFINIVESYNWHFDQYGPEEMPWLYEELEEDDSESEKDDKYPEFYYNMMSDVHQRVRRCTMFISSDVSYAFFFLKFTLEGIEGIKISDSVSGDG